MILDKTENTSIYSGNADLYIITMKQITKEESYEKIICFIIVIISRRYYCM